MICRVIVKKAPLVMVGIAFPQPVVLVMLFHWLVNAVKKSKGKKIQEH
jgi:hypothetical protein